jgi:hypothetical protein
MLISTAIGAVALPSTASAATILFNFEGGSRSFSFTLEQGQTPDSSMTFAGSNRVGFTNVAGTFMGVSGATNVASSVTFGTGAFGALGLSATGFGFGSFAGPALFNGSTTSPIFNLGTFSLGQVMTGPGTGGGRLTVSQMPMTAVPEPATWAMLILGFGMVGYSMRRRISFTPSLA